MFCLCCPTIVSGDQGEFTQLSTEAFDHGINEVAYQPILAGLVIHDKEVSSLDMLTIGDQYLVNLNEFAPLIQTSFVLDASTIKFITPAGNVQFLTDQCHFIDGELWLDIDTLNKLLYVNASFDQSKFALLVYPPWLDQTIQHHQQVSDANVDFRPNAFSFNQFRAEIESLKEPGGERIDHNELLASGAALGGSWRVELEQEKNSKLRPESYFWLKQNLKTQILLGQQTISPSVISQPIELTGFHYFSSNQEIEQDNFQDISQTGYFNELGNTVQVFRGKGEPGTLARLYVNGQFYGREFVSLDGTFDFGSVQLPSGLYNQIEIIFIDPLTKTILEERDISNTRADSLLNAEQQIRSIALGIKGSLLDPEDDHTGNAGTLLFRQGLSDQTTLEASYVYDEEEHADGSNLSTAAVGITQSLGKHYVSALRYAQNDQKNTAQLEFDGAGDAWRLSGFIRDVEHKLTENEKSTDANVFYQRGITPRLDLRLDGRYHSDSNKESFLLPGFDYNIMNGLSFSTRANANGDYRSDLRFNSQTGLQANLSYLNKQYSGRLDWNFTATVAAYYSHNNLSLGHEENRPNEEKAIGVYWRPDAWQPHGLLRAQVSQSDRDDMIYDLELRTQIFPGTFFDLYLTETESGPYRGTRILSRLTFDYSFARGRLVPASTTSSHNTNGTIIGTLALDREDCDIDEVNLLVGRSVRKAPVHGCQFQVNGLNPGIYQVRLDTAGLPIELVPDNKTYRVLVGASAISSVSFSLHKEFGIAGHVEFDTGRPLSNATLSVFNDKGMFVAYFRTDQFGYYRIDGLLPGRYEVFAINTRGQSYMNSLTVEIKEDFLFDQNMIVSEAEIISLDLDAISEPVN